MTCSGLLGLAVGFGNRQAQLRSGGDRIEDAPPATNSPRSPRQPEDIRKDPQVELAKTWLAKELHRRPQAITNWLYFLWSLERVGVVYGFDELDGVNWYDWGGAALLEAQNENGSWSGGFPPQVDTALALLFLRKANLARDLSGIAQLRSQPGDKDLVENPPTDTATPQAGQAAQPGANCRPPRPNASRPSSSCLKRPRTRPERSRKNSRPLSPSSRGT